MSGVEITLSKPIKAHGQDVSALTLREVTTKDLIELGNPFTIVLGDGSEGSSRIQISNAVVAKYISRLAVIPPSSVEQLAPSDFSGIQSVVLGFFGASADGQALS